MLTLESLTIRYGGLIVASNLSLCCAPGKIHALIGPSGCGKSTLLNVLCGIHREYEGRVLYDGKALDASGVRIGYVPQGYGLLDWKTVCGNIFLPWQLGPDARRRAGGPGGTDREREAREIIGMLGLDDVLDRYPGEISGGQRQRAALARAFVLNPDILLMDEPFSALDAFTAAACMELFLKLWREKRVTTLFITHNMHEAARLGERILVMGAACPGALGAPGEPEAQGAAFRMDIDNESFGSDDEDARARVVKRLSAGLREAMP
ncbi:ATP-binding cassette domain-containing protein [Desulfovibrio sp. OttesenSCG-928-I05]|nr:ATP-binding cassette domain-containing protein [Desulfovibrio sp. OttesenSCG-928-I05]